jgi:hypothetical protein
MHVSFQEIGTVMATEHAVLQQLLHYLTASLLPFSLFLFCRAVHFVTSLWHDYDPALTSFIILVTVKYKQTVMIFEASLHLYSHT